MVRQALLAIALSVPQAAIAQASDASPAQPSASEEPPQAICISILRLREKITVGRGPNKLEIILGGGACEPPGSQISLLEVRIADDEGISNDVVVARTCPAFQNRLSKLWSSRKHRAFDMRADEVRAGPLLIADWSDLFDLQTIGGRRTAVRWFKETLEVVRPCWNNFRDDRTLGAAQRLYLALGMKPLDPPS